MSATGASIRAGGAFVELTTKNDGLYNGLRQASKRIKMFSAAFIAVGSKMSGIAAGLGNSLMYAAHGASIAGGESAKFLNGFNKEGLLAIQTTGGIAGKLGTVKSKASVAALALGSLGAQIRAVGSFLSGMGRTAMGFGSVLAAPLLYAAKSASDAEEALNKFMSVFGKEGPAAKKFVEDIAVEFGRSRTQIMASMSAFQSIFVGLGFGQREAHKLSQRFQRMAIDFASFHNISEQETMGRFLSAMSGSAEVLDQFGVNIRAQALEQEFLRMGIKATAQTATESQKTMARLNIIQGAMQRQGAIGDALRTSGSAQNQMKRLQGILEDMVVTVGKALLPSLVDIMRKVGDAAKAFAGWAKDNQGVIVAVGGIVLGLTAAGVALMAFGPAIAAVGTAIGAVAFGFKSLLFVVGLMKSAFMMILTPIGLVLKIADFFLTDLVLKAASGTRAISTLGKGFSDLAGIATTTWGGITDLIAAGDWAGAIRMAMAGMQTAWTVGIEYLSMTWSDFAGFFVDAFIGPATRVANAFGAVWSFVESIFSKTSKFVADVWSGAMFFASQRTSEMADSTKVELDLMEGWWTGLAKWINAAWVGIDAGFLTIINGWASAWDHLCTNMGKLFRNVTAAVEIGWLKMKEAATGGLMSQSEAISRIEMQLTDQNNLADRELEVRDQERGREISGSVDAGQAREDDIDATAQREQRQRNAAQMDRAAVRAQDRLDSSALISRAKEELDALRERAKFDRENAEYWNSWTVGGGGGLGGLGGMSTTLANATSKIETKGTFSAAAAGALGASSLKKSEDLLAKIERNTGDMARPAYT